MRIIIIGAGLTGLSCGVALAMRGHEVVIVEREAEVGGLARTFRSNGFTFDYGPHYLFGTQVLQILKEILSPELDLINVKRTQERMYFKGKYFKFPFEPKNMLLNLEFTEMVGALFDLGIKRIFKCHRQSSVFNVEDWVIQSVGKRIYDYTSLGGYIEKLYGIEATRISKDWGIQKLKFLSKLQDANLLKLTGKVLGEKKGLERQVVSYPPLGIDRLSHHIRDRFLKLGGRIYFSAEVNVIEEKGKSISLVFQKNGGQESLKGDFLVSTIPVTMLLDLIKPSPPEETVRFANALRYRATVLFLLCLAKERAMDYQCLYFTENNIPFRRITEFKNLDHRLAPEGKTSLCVEVTCFKDDEIFREDVGHIFHLVIKELEERRFLKMGDIEKYYVLKVPHAYPVYNINYNVPLRKTLESLLNYQNVISFGRQGLFFYNNMSHSILKGHMLGTSLSDLSGSNKKKLIEQIYDERLEMYG